MSGEILLDTNIVIALFAGDVAVQSALSQSPTVYVPSIVLGELYYGANTSARAAQNLAKVDEFRAASSVLNVDGATAQEYGRIKNALRLKGRPLPENDIWIAAIAKQHDLVVISRDAHFREINGIVVDTW